MEAGRAAGKGQNSWGGKDETKSYGGADGATGLVAHQMQVTGVQGGLREQGAVGDAIWDAGDEADLRSQEGSSVSDLMNLQGQWDIQVKVSSTQLELTEMMS